MDPDTAGGFLAVEKVSSKILFTVNAILSLVAVMLSPLVVPFPESIMDAKVSEEADLQKLNAYLHM